MNNRNEAPQTPQRPAAEVNPQGKKKLTPVFERTLKDMREQRAVAKDKTRERQIQRGRKLTYDAG